MPYLKTRAVVGRLAHRTEPRPANVSTVSRLVAKRLGLPTLCLMTLLSLGLATSLRSPQVVFAQNDGGPSLSGLSAVFVLVEDLPAGTKLRGLSKNDIQSEVERRLHVAGLRVVSAEESARLPGGPYVYVRVNLVDHGHAVSVDVQLTQGALLVRNGQFLPSTITWSRSALLSKPTVQNIRDAVNDRVDAFVNAWLAVNPQRKS
jgi:hypothetical protein